MESPDEQPLFCAGTPIGTCVDRQWGHASCAGAQQAAARNERYDVVDLFLRGGPAIAAGNHDELYERLKRLQVP